MDALEGAVRVLMFGAQKYAPNDWRKGAPYTETYESLMRHLQKFMRGEDLDPESGLPHLDHALINIIFLKWFSENRTQFDDRWEDEQKRKNTD